MRVLVASMVLASLLVVPASAQDGGRFLEDPEGDTELRAIDGPGATPTVPFTGADSKAADLRFLDVQEGDEDITFTVGVSAMSDQASMPVSYRIGFEWRGTDVAVWCDRGRAIAIGFSGEFCGLDTYGSGYGYGGAYVPSRWDVAASLVSVTVPKVYILDDDERAPTRGDVLKGITVESRQRLTVFGLLTEVVDFMPDEDGKDFTLSIGDVAEGHLRLTTEDRVRVSNGGATTFVFQANLSNSGETDDTVRLEATDLPEGWNVTLQSPIRVPAQGSVLVAVLASVPFGHQHGGYDAFNVTATSGRDAGARATMRLGVLHTPIPQPAGHHAELYLHADASQRGVFSQAGDAGAPSMNTDGAHDKDAAAAWATDFEDDKVIFDVPLDPGLAMGLDFDMNRTGSLVGAVTLGQEAAAKVTAKLLLVPLLENEDEYGFYAPRYAYDMDAAVVLAESDAADIAGKLNSAVDFALTLAPTPEADYVPYAPKQNLVLRVEVQAGEMTVCCLFGAEPTLATEKFLLTLPLNEYHDRLTGLNEALSAIELRADGLVEKAGRPGTVMTYVFHLTNPMETDFVMDVDVAGNRADLGTLVPSGLVTVPAKGEVKLTLAVSIPAEAASGEELEVLVFAHGRDDPSVIAIGRTKTLVSQGSDAAPDETAVLVQAQAEAGDNDSPGPGALLVLGAAGGAALALRRRR